MMYCSRQLVWGAVFIGAGLFATPAAAQQPARGMPTVRDISLSQDGPDRVLTIELSSPAAFAVFPLTDPHRIVVDIANVTLPQGSLRIQEPEGLFAVRGAQFSVEPPAVRVVLDLPQALQYQTLSNSPADSIVIRVRGPAPEPEPPRAPGAAAEPILAPPLPSLPDAARVPLPRDARGLAHIGHSVLPDGTERVTLAIVSRCAYQTFVLSDPARICLDLDNVANGLASSGEPYVFAVPQPAAVTRVRAARILGQPPITRVIIDIPRLLPYQVHSWSAQAFYLTVDISPRVPDIGLVVIDPGHGGSEPGASGRMSSEKRLNLEMALRLQRALTARGIVALVTRCEDQYLGLYERAWYANEAGADLFVSIHCNAQPGFAQGTSVWYTHDRSFELARLAHGCLLSGLGRPDKGVRTARFVVTREAQMPAILCEIAYIDDPQEEALLVTPAFQEKAAQSIASAVEQYLTAVLERRRLACPLPDRAEH